MSRKKPRKMPLLIPKDVIKEYLMTPKYRSRVVRDRTKYDRKRLPRLSPKCELGVTEGGRMLVGNF
jgi:hypothetical protein